MLNNQPFRSCVISPIHLHEFTFTLTNFPISY